MPWELLISSSLLISDHFASFSHSLTLPGGQERKNKNKKSPIPGLHGISYPASFSSVSVLLFSSFPHTCASILPYPPSKNKVTGSQLLGSVYNPVRGPQYEWKVFFFPIKVTATLPPFLCFPLYPSIPYLIPSRRPGSTHPLDLFVTCFVEGRLGCIYNSQPQLAGFFLLSSTPLIQFAHSLLLTSERAISHDEWSII